MKKIAWPVALAPALLALAFAGLQGHRCRREIADLQAAQTPPPALSSEESSRHSLHMDSPVKRPPEPLPAKPIRPDALEPVATPPLTAVNNPEAEVSPAGSESWLAQFDRAMDREFSRIEEREQFCRDPEEVKLLGALKASLLELDRVWAEMDAGGQSDADRDALIARSREIMGMVIRLGTTHRNLRLSQVAHAVGLTDENQISLFISEIDQVFRDTQLDWASLFSRGM